MRSPFVSNRIHLSMFLSQPSAFESIDIRYGVSQFTFCLTVIGQKWKPVKLQEFGMYDFEETGSVQEAEENEDTSLILDGTANVEYSIDEQPPRVKGLVELFSRYFGD